MLDSRDAGVLEFQFQSLFEVGGEFDLGEVEHGVQYQELSIDRNEDTLEPVPEEREGPRVQFLAGLAVLVSQKHVSGIRSLEPDDVFLLESLGLGVVGSYLGALHVAGAVDLGHLGSPEVIQDFYVVYFF